MDHQGRIYALHTVLRQATRPVSTERLCEELDCSKATLRRIVQQMRDQFFAPIESSQQGGGYWYSEADRKRFELPGLWFNTAELLALTTCLELLRNVEPGVLEPQINPLRERIKNLLEKQSPTSTSEVSRVRILGLAARLENPRVFRVVAEAVLLGYQLTFDYYARSNGEYSDRHVSPQRLTHYRDNWYLDAFDHGRNALRTFSLDCIQSPQNLPDKTKNISDAQLNRELGAGYGIFSGTVKHTAVLRFTPERARWVADEQWHPKQERRFLDDGHFELRIPYAREEELMMDILKYGPDVEVISPAGLRKAIITRLTAATNQYEKNKS